MRLLLFFSELNIVIEKKMIVPLNNWDTSRGYHVTLKKTFLITLFPNFISKRSLPLNKLKMNENVSLFQSEFTESQSNQKPKNVFDCWVTFSFFNIKNNKFRILIFHMFSFIESLGSFFFYFFSRTHVKSLILQIFFFSEI